VTLAETAWPAPAGHLPSQHPGTTCAAVA
jgi:hypothetical protein